MAESIFVQSLTYIDDDGEQELDIGFLKSLVYIETIDLSGPKLIVRLNDYEGVFREDVGISEGGVIRATLADPYVSDNMHLTEDFDILSTPVSEDDVLTLNCLSSVVNALKQPADTGRFFVDMTARQILSELVPDIDIDAAEPPVVEPYHLLPGKRPSGLIRKMAKEQGCVAFYCRGKLIYKPLDDLFNADSAFDYHYNDNRQRFQLGAYRQISAHNVLRDKSARHYVGWHKADGLIESSGTEGYPAEFTGLTSSLTLNNMATLPVPVLDAFLHGQGGLSSGLAISITWNRENLESPLLESLPEKIVIGTVAHQYTFQKYHCRIKGVLPESLI
ncbi:hypothetical protein [Endozoicomonas lisbonensis]|uniref:Phage tail protein n=1 Tax=Endozoicomonas lisbonensis TaxID=3120522 RepID=A0ABV2SP99_9GAMM